MITSASELQTAQLGVRSDPTQMSSHTHGIFQSDLLPYLQAEARKGLSTTKSHTVAAPERAFPRLESFGRKIPIETSTDKRARRL